MSTKQYEAQDGAYLIKSSFMLFACAVAALAVYLQVAV